MGLPEIVDSARSSAVLVKVQGPDPKGLKMRNHAFHQYHSGNTTLSASGTILPVSLYNREAARTMLGDCQDFYLVLTVASVVEPFLSLKHKGDVSQDGVKLIPGARIDLMVEGMVNSERESPSWFPAQLLTLVDVPLSATALQSLIEASPSSKDSRWDVGWSLVSRDYSPHPSSGIIQTQTELEGKSLTEKAHDQLAEAHNPTLMANSATRLAVLAVSSHSLDWRDINLSSSLEIGGFLLAVGSPFGALSSAHFFNSISAGSISNCYPPGSPRRSLLIADIRCLPGMEGSPVFDKLGHLVGIFIRPLRQKNINAEIQLVIPWEAIASACGGLLVKESCIEGKAANSNKGTLGVGPEKGFARDSYERDGHCHNTHNYTDISTPPELLVEKAKSSVCLIAINESVWASGVVLNDNGLILTNAHLLEPWRFGRANLNGGPNEIEFEKLVNSSSTERKADNYQILKDAPTFVPGDVKGYRQGYFHGTHGNILVRLSQLDAMVWYHAKVVYISKGPLDVALLQLENAPDELCPIIPDFNCPALGSKAYVIGHGLLGPRCGFPPSLYSGVVAKVVKIKAPSYSQFVLHGTLEFPAMLETTAAVHPGGSGGAVVNSNGCMIGLVTSNARHGKGAVIPHLNFSIPSSVLAPIFRFARDKQDITVLKSLEKPNKELTSVWALMPPLSPKQNPSLPSLFESKRTGEKGYRFAKFIADNHKALQSPQSLVGGNQDMLRNVISRSKL